MRIDEMPSFIKEGNMNMSNIIENTKRKLIAKARKKGFTENFGEKEINNLKNKYGYNPYGTEEERSFAEQIQELERWCWNLDLSDIK